MKKERNRFYKRFLAVACVGVMLMAQPMGVLGKSSETAAPYDAVKGGVVNSTIYGEVLVTKDAGGHWYYTFNEPSKATVKQLLEYLNGGLDINVTKLVTASALSINEITSNFGDQVDLIANAGEAVGDTRGTYNVGSVYGTNLSQEALDQLALAVSSVLITNNTPSLDDYNKIRIAHDTVVNNVTPVGGGNSSFRDNAYGALNLNNANSKGYSRAMKALLDAMGVRSVLVSTNSNSSLQDYMFNMVRIGTNWYIIDAYRDDQTGSYDTFMISDGTYEATGIRWTKGGKIPVAKNNYF